MLLSSGLSCSHVRSRAPCSECGCAPPYQSFAQPESRDTVKVGVGLIATMTALVLGLVTASAKSSFDAVDSAVNKPPLNSSLSTAYLLATGPRPARFARACSAWLGPEST